MILVTGDVALGHNIYAGSRPTPDSEASLGMQHRTQPGGATLIYGLLEALEAVGSPATKAGQLSKNLLFGLKEMTADSLQAWPSDFQVGAVWDAYESQKKDQPQWRVSKTLGYGKRTFSAYPATAAPGLAESKPQLVVIDDNGLGFRLKTADKCWPPFLQSAATAPELQWIILKMSRPVARGDLWRVLVEKWRERLIVVISADNLRSEDVRVSRGLSWESTVDDLVAEIKSNPTISDLKSCRHLVVALNGDAALWLDRPGEDKHGACRLVFDPERGEGEWEDSHRNGNAIGFLSAMTSALAWHLKGAKIADEVNLVPALRAGLSTTRFLCEYGHGPVKGGEPGFPFKEAAAQLLTPTQKYATSEARCSATCCKKENAQSGTNWTMLSRAAQTDAFPGPLYGPARRLALLGPVALENVPSARFEKLLTMDRREMEALRSMRRLMLSYSGGGKQKQPLSLAVFGAPGSGKSFGLKQIAAGVFGKDNSILEFNLSQFKGPEDLIGAYHQVRDQALAGFTPVVFWDEFDSANYKWLQFLLAPMQDGTFQEGQLSHSIGKSVFVFAGGTSRDFAHFGPPEKPELGESDKTREARHDFVMKKGPDFKSRLAGFFDVLGPNPGQNYDIPSAEKNLDPWVDDPTDVGFPVRRAILIRSLLGLVKETENEVLQIDRGLLTALLEICHYRNGARSMEKLIGSIRDSGGLPLRRAHLPPDNLLALYVDSVEDFHKLTQRSNTFLAQAERLAPALHEVWLTNLTADEKEKGGSYVRPYVDLDQEGRAANIAAASRISELLSLVGFVLEEGVASDEAEKAVQAFLESNIEFLAEAEHLGWEEQKRMEGWTYGLPPKDNERRTHPLLISYSELPEEEKDKDRRAITNYPKYARIAGFRIASRQSGR